MTAATSAVVDFDFWRGATGADGTEVLLRRGLRPALRYGRSAEDLPVQDKAPLLFFTEVVAGVIEPGEVGEQAIRKRAVDEAWEEAGIRVDPATVELLGSSFPSPGMTPEKFWLAAAHVEHGVEQSAPEGDGSPMEEGSSSEWVSLSEAIARCDRGEIEDAKTELVLRRLQSRQG